MLKLRSRCLALSRLLGEIDGVLDDELVEIEVEVPGGARTLGNLDRELYCFFTVMDQKIEYHNRLVLEASMHERARSDMGLLNKDIQKRRRECNWVSSLFWNEVATRFRRKIGPHGGTIGVARGGVVFLEAGTVDEKQDGDSLELRAVVVIDQPEEGEQCEQGESILDQWDRPSSRGGNTVN